MPTRRARPRLALLDRLEPSSSAGLPRLHVILLIVIALVGLVRGTFWVVVTPVFNPIDEGAHYAYVESMARYGRPPVVGRDRLSSGALDIIKTVRTSAWRAAPLPPSPADPRWGGVRESYEGVQGPLYYALVALPYRLAYPYGPLAPVYAVRLATLLLSLLAVPVAYLLARELFPARREAWLASPAVLVLLQGFNGNLSSITNDALVVPLAGVIMLTVARAVRRGLTGRTALLCGFLVGLGLATKSNMVALIPVVGLAVAGAAAVRRERWTNVVRWALFAAPGVLVAVLPWLWWNLVQYGSLSASEQVDLITGPSQPSFPLTREGLRLHMVWATIGYWDFQFVARPLGRYMWTLFTAGGGLLAGGMVVAIARRRLREAATFAWLASPWVLTVLTMLIVIYGVFDGRSSVIGRHVYPSLIAVVVLIVIAAFEVAGRWGGLLLLGLVMNVALSFEQPLVSAFAKGIYTDGTIGRLVPTVEQGYGDDEMRDPTVRVSAPCAVEAISFAFVGLTPASVQIVSATGTMEASRSGSTAGTIFQWDVYRLPIPLSGPLEVTVDDAVISASITDREPQLSLVGEGGDPVARVYCASDDPERARFAMLFTPDHPRWIRYGHITGWPTAWAWTAHGTMLAFSITGITTWLRRSPKCFPRSRTEV